MQQADHLPRPLSRIKLRGQTKKRVAAQLLQLHLAGQQYLDNHEIGAKHDFATTRPVRVVCVADTHNTQPVLPPGDILIHAGDLTENGSFTEMQAGLAWLAAQRHRHKILIAGNHDVLLDENFLTAHSERRYGQGAEETRAQLDWGDVTYLQDRLVALPVGEDGSGVARTVTVYGAPWTPKYGVSAFQYGPVDAEAHWAERLGGFSMHDRPDILVTHGPPKLHRDQRDWYRAGCAYLAAHVARLHPRLCVFGHIHVGYGREDDVHIDTVRWQHDTVAFGWAGWEGVAWLAVLVAVAFVRRVLARGMRLLLCGRWRPGPARVTTFVNAAVVGGPRNELLNAPVVVEI